MCCLSRSGDARRPHVQLPLLRGAEEPSRKWSCLCLTNTFVFCAELGNAAGSGAAVARILGDFLRLRGADAGTHLQRTSPDPAQEACSYPCRSLLYRYYFFLSSFSLNCALVEITGVHLSEWCRFAPARFNYQYHMTHSNYTQCYFSHLYLFVYFSTLLNRQPDFYSRLP